MNHASVFLLSFGCFSSKSLLTWNMFHDTKRASFLNFCFIKFSKTTNHLILRVLFYKTNYAQYKVSIHKAVNYKIGYESYFYLIASIVEVLVWDVYIVLPMKIMFTKTMPSTFYQCHVSGVIILKFDLMCGDAALEILKFITS